MKTLRASWMEMTGMDECISFEAYMDLGVATTERELDAADHITRRLYSLVSSVKDSYARIATPMAAAKAIECHLDYSLGFVEDRQLLHLPILYSRTGDDQLCLELIKSVPGREETNRARIQRIRAACVIHKRNIFEVMYNNLHLNPGEYNIVLPLTLLLLKAKMIFHLRDLDSLRLLRSKLPADIIYYMQRQVTSSLVANEPKCLGDILNYHSLEPWIEKLESHVHALVQLVSREQNIMWYVWPRFKEELLGFQSKETREKYVGRDYGDTMHSLEVMWPYVEDTEGLATYLYDQFILPCMLRDGSAHASPKPFNIWLDKSQDST